MGLESGMKKSGSGVDTAIMLLGAPILLAIYVCCGNVALLEASFFARPDVALAGFYARVSQFAVFFLLVFVLPIMHITIRLRHPLSAYGFGLGVKREGVLAAALGITFLVLPMAYIGAKMPDVQAEYPLCKDLCTNSRLIFWYYLSYAGLYYLAWEFYFRGYLLFGLAEKFGALNAILIQTIPSCLVHIGKPQGELLGSIPFGIALGFLAIRTGSFWYGFCIHVALGILTDFFILSGSG